MVLSQVSFLLRNTETEKYLYEPYQHSWNENIIVSERAARNMKQDKYQNLNMQW